jgi:glucokinase
MGAARSVDDMAMITLGTGVGGGILLGGTIWHGMMGMAGELGHMTVEPEGQQCGCGNRGCLEQYASATAIVRMAREQTASLNPSEPSATALSIYDLACNGSGSEREVFRRVGRALGIAIAGLVNALNLPMYVIGGAVSNAWDEFAPSMFQELQQRSVVYAASDPRPSLERIGAARQVEPSGEFKTTIAKTLLGSDAGLYGAARLAMVVANARK